MNLKKTITKPFKKIKLAFKRKKKMSSPSWGKRPVPELPSSEPKPKPFAPVETKKPRKLQFKWMRTTKRLIAAFMLLINLAIAFSGFSIPGGATLAILFLLNVFIFLDYLHKTKKIKVEWEEKK